MQKARTETESRKVKEKQRGKQHEKNNNEYAKEK